VPLAMIGAEQQLLLQRQALQRPVLQVGRSLLLPMEVRQL